MADAMLAVLIGLGALAGIVIVVGFVQGLCSVIGPAFRDLIGNGALTLEQAELCFGLYMRLSALLYLIASLGAGAVFLWDGPDPLWIAIGAAVVAVVARWLRWFGDQRLRRSLADGGYGPAFLDRR